MSIESAPCEILTLISRDFTHADFANFALSCTYVYDNIYYQRRDYIKHRSKFTPTLKTICGYETILLHKHHYSIQIIISIHDCIQRRVYLRTTDRLICYSNRGTNVIEGVNLDPISIPYIVLSILYYVNNRDNLPTLMTAINDYLK